MPTTPLGATPATWINPPQPSDATLPGDENTLSEYVKAWWVNEALHDPGAAHRIRFFFHQFLAATPMPAPALEFYDYLMLRWGCLGNFKNTGDQDGRRQLYAQLYRQRPEFRQ